MSNIYGLFRIRLHGQQFFQPCIFYKKSTLLNILKQIFFKITWLLIDKWKINVMFFYSLFTHHLKQVCSDYT